MPDIIISSHGGRWSNQQRNLQLPAGSSVVFYVNDDEVLPNDAGYDLLEDLEAGTVDQSEIVQTVGPNQSTYDYSCWYAPEFAADCGIYAVGEAQRQASLRAYTEARPLLLSQILAQYPNCTIYWLACREVSDVDPIAKLRNAPGSYLTKPRTKPKRPAPEVEPAGEVPGASVLGYGFNALGTYDLSSITQQIFKHGNMQASTFTYAPTNITYWVPDNASVIPNTTTSGSAQVFSTRQQFQSYFAAKASISGSYGAFSAQFDAAYSQTFSTEESFYYGLYEADYTGWTLALADQSSSWLSPGFTEDPDVKALPSTFSAENQEMFFKVFRKFGTHFVAQLTVGGSFDYYVAVETAYSSNEAQVETNLSLEYDALFVSGSAESSAEWNQLGKTWTDSRVAKVDAVGGDTSVLDTLQLSFGASYADVFGSWTSGVMKNPAVISFQLRPLGVLFSGAVADAVAQALLVYLNGAIVATANSDYTPGSGPGGGNFTTSSTIIANGQLIQPIPPVWPPQPHVWPPPSQIVSPLGGYQVAVLESDTLNPILSYTYYQDSSSLSAEKTVYDDIMKDVAEITHKGYYVVVAGFAVDLMNYPTVAFSQWLASCGAQMTGWRQYIGFTGSPGQASYVLIGRQGLLPGNAVESFAAVTDWADRPWQGTTDTSALALLYADTRLVVRGVQGNPAFRSLAASRSPAKRSAT
jgi:hypothetical protein